MMVKMHPKSFKECLESLGEAPYIVPKEMFCNATWDTVLCWPPTLRGSDTKMECPGQSGIYVTKYCGIDGNWLGKFPGKETFPKEWYPGYTNYSHCKGVEYPEFVTSDPKNISDHTYANVSEVASISLGALPLSHNGADVLASILLIVSIILMVTSLFIACCSRGIQTTRSKFYRNLYATFIFHDLIELFIRLGRVSGMDDVINKIEMCVSSGVLVTLTSSAIITWFTIIGVCFVMSMKGLVIETKMYFVLCLLGWFVPTVVTITWLSVTVLEGNLHCWYGELYIAKLHASFWIIEGVDLALLTFCWVFLVYFLWKFKEHISQRRHCENKELSVELANIKQNARRVLVVVCYVTVAHLIYLASSQVGFTAALEFLVVITLFTRGIVAAVFFCFLEDYYKCWDGMYSVEGHLDDEG